MTRTRFHDDHRELIPGRADGYSGSRRRGWRISNTATDHVGDGGLFSSIEELFFWERFWTEPGRLEGGAELQKIMLERGPLKGGKTTEYALGLVHGKWRSLKTVSHGGAWVGFRTNIFRIPSEKLSVICLANFSGARTHRLTASIAAVWATTAR